MTQPYLLGVRELGLRMRAGTLSAVELLDHYLGRIETLNPRLNAFIDLDETGARQAARDADDRAKRGASLGPLDGIPIAIKDNILVKGQRAVWGTRLFEQHVPDHDEVPVDLLRRAGAVLVGKTNVPEFTMRGYTDNVVFGPTGNAWDPALTPGGSSGGSVTAVAAGLVPLALGTDGGGSIRRPAGYTGLVGLKPTVSRIPRANGFPQILYDCEIVGPLGRSVDDVRLMMSVMARPDRRDQRSRGFAPIDQDARPVRPLRIVYVARMSGAPVDPEIDAACRRAAEALRALGHEVTDGSLPFETQHILGSWSKIGDTGLAMLAEQHPSFFDRVTPGFAEQARTGAGIAGAEFMRVIETLYAFRTEVGSAFEHVDLIMTPTSAAHPWPKEQAYPPVIDGQEVGPRGHAVFTNWVNACGHPAIALPAAPSAQGLPIGFQLVGDFGADDLLLDIATQFEQAQPWAGRWPQLASL
jgi:aspartyl-tRNA(Asn)/glutamyl-tRNA(Gln) amidotransferase subunit A